MKYTLNVINMKLDTIKKINKFQLQEKKISQMKHKEKKKRMNKKQKQSIRKPRNNFKQSDIHTIAIPKGEERRSRKKQLRNMVYKSGDEYNFICI